MKPYADTNFFTRLYLSLPESDQADRLVHMAKAAVHPFCRLPGFTGMELANALSFLFGWASRVGHHV